MDNITNEEIDKLIATKIMGWEIREVDFTSYGSYYEAYFQGEKRLGIVGAYEFFPSEFIQDAWKVVKTLSKENYTFEMRKFDNEDKYMVWFYKTNSLTTQGTYGETAPLAICKAALKAVSHD